MLERVEKDVGLLESEIFVFGRMDHSNLVSILKSSYLLHIDLHISGVSDQLYKVPLVQLLMARKRYQEEISFGGLEFYMQTKEGRRAWISTLVADDPCPLGSMVMENWRRAR